MVNLYTSFYLCFLIIKCNSAFNTNHTVRPFLYESWLVTLWVRSFKHQVFSYNFYYFFQDPKYLTWLSFVNRLTVKEIRSERDWQWNRHFSMVKYYRITKKNKKSLFEISPLALAQSVHQGSFTVELLLVHHQVVSIIRIIILVN
jgi:hypothetical protein